MYLIEEPSMYASIEAWRSFLTELEGLPQDDQSVKDAMLHAKAMIADKEVQAA